MGSLAKTPVSLSPSLSSNKQCINCGIVVSGHSRTDQMRCLIELKALSAQAEPVSKKAFHPKCYCCTNTKDLQYLLCLEPIAIAPARKSFLFCKEHLLVITDLKH